MTHERVLCSCGEVIRQCRCITPDKRTRVLEHPACQLDGCATTTLADKYRAGESMSPLDEAIAKEEIEEERRWGVKTEVKDAEAEAFKAGFRAATIEAWRTGTQSGLVALERLRDHVCGNAVHRGKIGVWPRDGGFSSLFCYDCDEWVANNANYEMQKEGVFSHDHVCKYVER